MMSDGDGLRFVRWFCVTRESPVDEADGSLFTSLAIETVWTVCEPVVVKRKKTCGLLRLNVRCGIEPTGVVPGWMVISEVVALLPGRKRASTRSPAGARGDSSDDLELHFYALLHLAGCKRRRSGSRHNREAQPRPLAFATVRRETEIPSPGWS